MSTMSQTATFAERVTLDNLHLLTDQLRYLPMTDAITLIRHNPPLTDCSPVPEVHRGVLVVSLAAVHLSDGCAELRIETNGDLIIIPIGNGKPSSSDATPPHTDAWVNFDSGLVMFSYETALGRHYITLMTH